MIKKYNFCINFQQYIRQQKNKIPIQCRYLDSEPILKMAQQQKEGLDLDNLLQTMDRSSSIAHRQYNQKVDAEFYVDFGQFNNNNYVYNPNQGLSEKEIEYKLQEELSDYYMMHHMYFLQEEKEFYEKNNAKIEASLKKILEKDEIDLKEEIYKLTQITDKDFQKHYLKKII